MNLSSKPMRLLSGPAAATTHFLLFGLILLMTAGCADKQEKFSEHYQKGLNYTKSNEPNSAVIEFRNAVSLAPKHADARYQLGLAYLKIKEPGKALQELERAATLDPENTDAQIKTAELYFLGQKLKESRHAIDRMLAVHPDNPDAHSLLARIELMENDPAAAEAAIDRALAADSENSSYYVIKASIRRKQERFEEAEALLKAALEKGEGPEFSTIQALAAFYMDQKDEARAEETYKRLVTEYPDRAEAYLEMARFYIATGQRAKAEKNILTAIDKKPSSAPLYVALAGFYRQNRDFEKAENAYQTAIANSDTPADIRAMLADLYHETGKIDAATALVDDILEKTPDHAGATLVSAKLLVGAKKNAEALEILNSLVEGYPRWGEAYYYKALAHLNKGETSKSLDATNQAAKFAGQNPDVRTLLAHHLFLKKDFEGARNNAAYVLQQTPDNFRAGIVLAKSLLSLGETEDASRLLEKMVSYKPEDVEILFNQSLAYLVGQKPEQARPVLEKILSIKPAFTPALRTLAGLLVQQQKPAEAIDAVKAHVNKHGENADSLILLAELLNNHTASHNEALAYLDTAQKIAPENPRVYTLTATILRKQGRTREAIEKYKTLTTRRPDAAEAFMALGTLLDETGDREGARNAYLKALDINPQFAAAANNLAWLIADSPNPDLAKALRMAMIAKENAPEDPYIADTLGWVYYKRGAYQLAISQFTQATEQKPDAPSLRYHLALALHANGQTPEARAELEKCIEAGKPFPEYAAAKRLLETI
ncbi:MAG: tetratricopeptide repeat protein [Thermodesulfobacteriota bacterium]|nr:tetratricopeptide repeat protein [Thermodesulfobacteriota bacterium]